MSGYQTSFSRLFEPAPPRPAVDRIEIPMFQRDYAQGRDGARVARIRRDFLDALRKAVVDGPQLALDFLYGEVEKGVLRPLDGQQRLTTLFLLHWYLAVRAGRAGEDSGWKRFSYATRPSARDFCEQLTRCTFQGGQGGLADWISDQAWYRYTWNDDPTIRSMLTMIDAIDARFGEVDAVKAWERLVDPQAPAVTFLMLTSPELGRAEELYIKMNSRGRPLTEFETFKARLEQIVESSAPGSTKALADRLDGEWSNLLWRYRGEKDSIDEAYQRYFGFLVELCEWMDGGQPEASLAVGAERTFGVGNPRAQEHLDFVMRAFDTWVAEDVAAWFTSVFSASPQPVDTNDPAKITVYREREVDLFAACCRWHGIPRGKGREFTLQSSLLLYGILLHRLRGVGDVRPRLRVLRNLVLASENEIREEQMPALLQAVEGWMLQGSLVPESGLVFNTSQVAEEGRKLRRLAQAPELGPVLHHLEDNDLLRGRLAAFSIDSDLFGLRAASFHRLFEDASRWLAVSGALLACGDYSRWKTVGTSFHLGSSENAAPWRTVFTKSAYEDAENTRTALEKLLDRVATSSGPLDECLAAVQAEWVAACEGSGRLGWRYYLVKYPVMRSGLSGIYVDRGGRDGFTMCMLDKLRLSARHRDPFLSAIREVSAAGERVKDPVFQGDEAQTLGLVLVTSGVGLRSAVDGFSVEGAPPSELAEAFREISNRYGVKGGTLKIQQVKDGELWCDVANRVEVAAAYVRELLAAGF